MSEREKIISIIQAAKYCDTNNRCEECKYDKESENNEDMSCGSLRIADALIAAGIGDVTAHEAEAEYWKTICKFESDEHHTAIKNAAEHARHLMQERDEYKHRAEAADRALENIIKQYWCAERGCNECEEKQGCIEGICSRYIQQAEREIEEEKQKWKKQN